MPFERGNPGGAYTAGMPKPWNKELRKATRSLAMAVRDGIKVDDVVRWLVSVWQGIDPAVPGQGVIVPLEARERALKMLLDRGWGQAAQMLVLEGELKHEAIVNAPPSERAPMTLAEIQSRRAAIRAALPNATVIDVPVKGITDETP